jgi:hypothetical protein
MGATIDSAAAVSHAATALASDINEKADEPIDPETLQLVIGGLNFQSELVVYAADPEVGPRLAWRIEVAGATTTTEPISADGDPGGTRSISMSAFDVTYFIYANGTEVGGSVRNTPVRSRQIRTRTLNARPTPEYTVKTFPSGTYLWDMGRRITVYRAEHIAWETVASDVPPDNGDWALTPFRRCITLPLPMTISRTSL